MSTIDIAQILHWMHQDETFRQFVFTAPAQTLAELEQAGFTLPPADRDRLTRITPDRFPLFYQREVVDKNRVATLTQPLPTLAYGRAAQTVEFGDMLNWLYQDTAWRETFFNDPDSALAYLTFAGYELSDKVRQLLATLTRDNFMARYQNATRSSKDLPDLQTAAERIVSTGFAAENTPAQPSPAHIPLSTNAPYYFWFEVGKRVEGSIEVTDVSLLESLPPNVRLNVVLFSFDREIQIFPGRDVGEIEVPATGPVRVTHRVASPAGADEALLDRRLFFPVQTPAQPGTYRLRCGIYYQQTLVQSRLITMQVAAQPIAGADPALLSRVDYTLSKTLDGRHLTGMGQTRLSLMLNDNGNGTHGFRFFGQNEFKNDATLSEGELKTLIEMARAALRRAAWGDESEYDGSQTYRYDGIRDMEQLREDLVRFAQRGYRFYADLVRQFAGSADLFTLADLMLTPGQLQLASKRSARLVVPLAMFYDYPFDDGLSLDDYSLCRTFTQALESNQPLADTPCFQGQCPNHGEDRIVCPSGFWGFRHSLGLPVSLDAAPDAPTKISLPGKPGLAVNVSTDPNFIERPKHEQALRKMGVNWEYADTRDGSLTLLKQTKSQVVYFYCHGGLANGLPFLSVGPKGGDRITGSNLLNKRIRWQNPRPLVVINGCHTTALSPEAALDLVTAFVGISQAAGVIGTEITIFEPIARNFAEAFFQLFLVQRQTVGEAVRGARLKLLQDWNPLGLVYIPFVLPGLQLE